MEVKWTYSKTQLEAAVKFISANNEYFRGQDDYIRESMLGSAQKLIKGFPDSTYISTMGYLVWLQIEAFESIDSDENEAFIEFWIDPNLGSRIFKDHEMITKITNTKDL